MPSKIILSDEERQKILNLYNIEKKSVRSISKLFNYSYTVIYRVIKESGVPIRGNGFTARKYEYDIHFFDVIDTEEKAYWLGFMYADGYVTIRGNTMQMCLTLSTNDKGHLEKFKKSLKSNLTIRDYVSNTTFASNTRYSRLTVSNNHICEQLIKKGCTRNKTNVVTFPTSDVVPNHLVHHFIRGYFDGDGCLTGSRHKKRDVFVYQIKIMGTKEFLEVLHEKLPVNRTLYLRQRYDDMKSNNWCLEIGGKKQVESILNYMYKDATIYLDRKMDAFKKFQQLA